MSHMTTEEYRKTFGERCPSCRSTDVQGESPDLGVGNICIRMMCYNCNARWTEEYTLSTYHDLETP